MRHNGIATAFALLFAASTVHAATMTSPGYTINAGGITSGGSSASDVNGMSKTGIAIGQAVYMPPVASSSPNYGSKPVVLTSPASGGGTLHTGDINGDGVVDIVDALLALKAGVGLTQLTAAEIVRGDVGPLVNNVPVGDGRIDIEDTILILRKSVGLSW